MPDGTKKKGCFENNVYVGELEGESGTEEEYGDGDETISS